MVTMVRGEERPVGFAIYCARSWPRIIAPTMRGQSGSGLPGHARPKRQRIELDAAWKKRSGLVPSQLGRATPLRQ